MMQGVSRHHTAYRADVTEALAAGERAVSLRNDQSLAEIPDILAISRPLGENPQLGFGVIQPFRKRESFREGTLILDQDTCRMRQDKRTRQTKLQRIALIVTGLERLGGQRALDMRTALVNQCKLQP